MARGILVDEFDTWQPDYAGARVEVFQAGSTTDADLFLDEALTLPTTNPQTLESTTDSAGIEYGKFAQSIYSAQAYYLEIDNFQQTGIKRLALTDLVGVEASKAVATSAIGTKSRTLADHFADAINVLDFGVFLPTSNNSASPATNNATLLAAIGAAAAAGGGYVLCPAGSYEITSVTIPGSVIITGRGKGVTTLVCKTADACFTLTGARAGFRDITLDGVNLVAKSVGVTGLNLNYVTLQGVEVKRFETGILWRGGSFHRYRDLWLANCVKNIRCLGDLNASLGSTGGPFTWLSWEGGQSIQATDTAVELSQVDQQVAHCCIKDVSISDNVTTTAALYLYGVQFIDVEACAFGANSGGPNIWLRDSANTSLASFQTASVAFIRGEISTGTILLDGLARNVLFDSLDLETCTIELNVPTGAVVLRDCIEIATALSGDTTKLERQTTRAQGSETGITTSATGLVAWQRKLDPGQVLAVRATVSAVQLNGLGFGYLDVEHAAHQLGASLNYNAQSANFTAGNTIQGGTSGATATIQADADSGTTGTLTLCSVNGTFIDGELISEISPGTGSAHVNGTLTINATALISTLVTLASAQAGGATGWSAVFDCNGQNLRLIVTGEAAKTIQWTVKVTETPAP